MANLKTMQLGKKAPRLDKRTFKLNKYLSPSLPPPPAEVSWVTHVPGFPMYLNNSIGDCVAAAAGHMVNQWTTYASGAETMVTDTDVLVTYEAVGGYQPGNPETDNGMALLSYLNYWRNMGLGGHKILAYASVDTENLAEVFQAIQLFGNLYIGLALPVSAQDQNDGWWVTNGGPFGDGSPGSWGGHCVPVVAASPQTLTFVTWGQTMKMSHNFFADYVDEAYVVLSQDWIAKTGLSPSQFDLKTLQRDLESL